jgi:rhomboid family protein
VFLGLWFVYQLVEANAGLGSAGETGGTAFFAHLGGFVFGAIVAIALVRSGRREGRFGGLQSAT